MKKIILIALSLAIIAGCSSTSSNISDPENKKAEIYYNQGTKKLVDKDYTSALDYLIKANKYKPNDSKILNNLGMAYFFKKRNSLAKRFLHEAIAVDNGNSNAKNNLASIYFKEKNYSAAEKTYKEILKDLIYKHQYRVHYNLALIALEQGNSLEANKRLDDAITESEEYCPAHFLKGKLALKRHLYKQAQISFELASKGLCYKNPAPIFYQATSLKNLMKYEKSLEKFEEVAVRFPSSKYSMMANNEIRELKAKHKVAKQISFRKELEEKHNNEKKDFLKRKDLIDFRNQKTKSFNSPEF